MKRLWSALAGVLLLCCAISFGCAPRAQAPLPLTASSPKPLRVIWSGTSGGFRISWTTKEISALANPPSRLKPIAFSDTGLTILDFSRAGDAQSSNCDFSRSSSVLSVVGPYISLLHDDEQRCGGAPAPTRRTQALAIDLRAPHKRPSLEDIFPSGALLVALLHTAAVATTLQSAHAAQPATLPQLMQDLHPAGAVCDAGFPPDLLQRFVFQQLRGHAVLMSIVLPLDCRTRQLGIWLPVPTVLNRALVLAASRKEGFLGADQPSLSHGLSTTILYHVRNSSGGQ